MNNPCKKIERDATSIPHEHCDHYHNHIDNTSPPPTLESLTRGWSLVPALVGTSVAARLRGPGHVGT
eukprot:11771556-Alexandrium_andersonii.AAC.1